MAVRRAASIPGRSRGARHQRGDASGAMRGWLNRLGSSITDAVQRWAGGRDGAGPSEAFRELAENSLQGMVVHDGRHRLFANQAFADMHGYPDVAAALTANELGQHIFPEDLVAV